MVAVDKLWIDSDGLSILMVILGGVTLLLMLSIGFCFMYKIRFEHHKFGPALFIYTYHVGSFYTINKTLNVLTKQFEKKNGLSIVADKFRMDINSLRQATAGIFYDDPNVCCLVFVYCKRIFVVF